jgi:DNA-binding NtrC family response regulator
LPDLSKLVFLILDDDSTSLSSIERSLKSKNAEVHVARNVDEAVDFLSSGQRLDAVLASIDLIDERLIEAVRDLKARYPESRLYVLTEKDYHFIDTSHEPARLLVDDYISKPVDVDCITELIRSGKKGGCTSLTIIDPLVEQFKPYFLFRSPVMRQSLAHLPQIARSDETVLITGETGTGKEIVARAIHVMSRRASGPFVPLNCGAIPESLIEGELFGHERGAFTGATKTRKGKFESADHGTLFLDEIGEMPLNLQVRLLRVLEDRRIYRVGGEFPITVNVRVIAASNVDLNKAVQERLFRRDLYYRLNILRVHLPPLRERIEDISLLAVHFLERAFSEMRWPRPYPTLSPESIRLLEACPWKGNVRELRNVMTRVATLLPRDTDVIRPFHILPHLETIGTGASLPQEGREGVFIPLGMSLREVEDVLIKETLRHTKGNKSKASLLLGISTRTLRRRLKNRTI